MELNSEFQLLLLPALSLQYLSCVCASKEASSTVEASLFIFCSEDYISYLRTLTIDRATGQEPPQHIKVKKNWFVAQSLKPRILWSSQNQHNFPSSIAYPGGTGLADVLKPALMQQRCVYESFGDD
jgi:hypothetical protein